MLLRAYSHPRLYPQVFFLIMQSKNCSSFHPPIVCYPALGYTIEEEGKVNIPIQNVSWVEGPLYGVPATERLYSNATLPVKKLIVTKQSGEKVTERRVVLYFYVKESPFTSANVTMIRVSALAPRYGSYDKILNVTAKFMGDTVPCLFEIQREEQNFFSLLAYGSVFGKVAIVLLFLAPLSIIFYSQIRNVLNRKVFKGK